ncbi:MAG: hypothetical protein LBH95_07880 [Oscillospiraceae bacterium]|nr:hypothetical protein [Oscillospiraceae bacterium]
MKKVLAAIILVIMLIAVPCNTFVNIDVISDKMFLRETAEGGIVSNYINNALSEIQSATDVPVACVSNSQMSDVIRVYQVENDVFSLYEKWQNIDSVLNGRYSWEIPVYNAEGEVVTSAFVSKLPTIEEAKAKGYTLTKETQDMIEKTSGQWSMSRIGNKIPENYIQLLSNRNSVSKLLTDLKMEANAIMLIELPLWTYALCITTEDEEYGVPFSYQEEITSLENGKLYKMGDLIEKLSVAVNAYNTSSEEGIVYGTGAAAQHPGNLSTP